MTRKTVVTIESFTTGMYSLSGLFADSGFVNLPTLGAFPFILRRGQSRHPNAPSQLRLIKTLPSSFSSHAVNKYPFRDL